MTPGMFDTPKHLWRTMAIVALGDLLIITAAFWFVRLVLMWAQAVRG